MATNTASDIEDDSQSSLHSKRHVVLRARFAVGLAAETVGDTVKETADAHPCCIDTKYEAHVLSIAM